MNKVRRVRRETPVERGYAEEDSSSDVEDLEGPTRLLVIRATRPARAWRRALISWGQWKILISVVLAMWEQSPCPTLMTPPKCSPIRCAP